MKFSYNWLQSFFRKKLPKPEKLAEILTLHFAEVEEVQKIGNDFTLDIDVRPNRTADCFSHIGIAREIAAIANLKFTEPREYRERFSGGYREPFSIAVEVKQPQACPRYTAKVMTDVRIGPSPKWLKERLEVCGLNSINNVVDVANYVMLETGQPLHAFDAEKLAGGKIIVRFAKNGEKITTLDGQKFNLSPEILVIADAEKPVAIAGIKGGKLPEIDNKTRTIVLESANFNPRAIRKGSRKLELKTDASLRFEHGLDPNLTKFAINRAACLVQKVAGGKAAKRSVDIYPKKVYPKRIKLDLNYVESLLGIKIPGKEIKRILTSLGLKIENCKLKILNVVVPTFRLDVSIPEDLIEEIGRIFGYEKIPAVFPDASLIPPKRNLDIFWEEMAKNILKEAGFTEVYNYSFFSEKEARLFGYQNKDLVELENPMSNEQQYLRASLIPNLLKNIENNQKNFSEIKIFELGKIFGRGGERKILTGAMTGDMFYQAKGVIDSLLQKMGISNIWYDEYQPTPQTSKISIWRAGKYAEIKVDNEEVGFLGELKIKQNLCVFDIDFEKLSKLASEEHEYQPISRFPAAVRDIAVLVPRFIRVEEVLNKIEAAGGSLVRDVDLFDIYEGEELPEGKKNLAFHIIYQSDNKTLTSKEVEEMHQKIINALEKIPGWQVRR